MIALFDYQQKALDLIIEAFVTRMAALVVMATGLGKTVVAAFWAKRELKKKRRGLFLCHDTGILDQAMIEFQKVLEGNYALKTFYGDRKDWRADEADIVFASFQSYFNWKEAFFEDEFDFIIIDESHHGQAPTFKEVIQYFKPKKLLGITATPDRMDLKDIREIFGEEIVDYSLEEAIAKGWLTQVEYHILNDLLNHWKLKKIVKDVMEKGKRISVKQLNESIFIKKRDEEIAKIIQEYAGASKKAIIFCEKIQHAENFQKFLPGALAYHSRVGGGAKENRRRLNAFREGKLQYILAVDKFNEGIDIPDAELIVFLRCTDSKTIFYQQLGRGLRKVFGKEKVIILDFVANCDRLTSIREMIEKVKTFTGNGFMLNRDVLHIEGEAFDFIFSDEQVEILNLIRRIEEPLYDSWKEASQAAIRFGIKSKVEYIEKYRFDPKLPSSPWNYYPDFPNMYVFLGKKAPRYYATWQEASAAAVELGIKSCLDYKKNRTRLNPALPNDPRKKYENFPGWDLFLSRKKIYPIWQEASAALKKIGIKSYREYRKTYKKDPQLPYLPVKAYADFPGWNEFLGNVSPYPTWREASAAAIKLGFKTNQEYRKGYKKDPRLTGSPRESFSDFPGWVKFLGKKRKIIMNFYPTWQEAGKAATALGINDQRQYFKKHKSDPKLPGSPRHYYDDFPNWVEFFGAKKKDFYKTWQEASAAAIKMGISRHADYRKRYIRDSKLPSNPNVVYEDFPGFIKFFGGKKKDFYKTWQRAGKRARKIGITNSLLYKKYYHKDSKLPSNPNMYYRDFPGWNKFLGKK